MRTRAAAYAPGPLGPALVLFRAYLGCAMVAHGVARLMLGTVPGFGGFLSARGWPFGELLAWGITLYEVLGGLALAAGFLVPVLSGLFIVELLVGIVLVHWPVGWFVVGATQGGMEYSVCLIASFLVVSSADLTASRRHAS